MKLFLIVVALAALACANAHVADYGDGSVAPLSTLYETFNEIIIELDEDSFDDTVHCDPSHSTCTAFVVQFYNHRTSLSSAMLVPYLNVSLQAYPWRSIVKIATVNCGDSYNEDICDRHSFDYSPFIKYFSKSSTPSDLGSSIELSFNTEKLLSAIVREVREDYHKGKYRSWPNFEPIPNGYSSVENFWANVISGRDEIMVIYVDSLDSPMTMNLLLVFHIASGGLPVRLVMKGHLLDEKVPNREYPYGAVLARRYSNENYCNNPELSKKKSIYGPMMEHLGLNFERGDRQVLGANAIYKCKNDTSSIYDDDEMFNRQMYGYEVRSKRTARSVHTLLDAKDKYELDEFCYIPAEATHKEVPQTPEIMALLQKHPLHHHHHDEQAEKTVDH